MLRKVLFALLMAVSTAVFGGSATVTWTNPETNTDGSAIPASGAGSLTGTRVQYATCSGLVFNGALTSVQVPSPMSGVLIDGLAPGTWCFEAFASNTYGIESVASARVAKLVPAVNTAPVLTQPGNQTTVRGAGVNLQLVASDANGDALTFSATGLPTGVILSSASGLITGSPTTAGTYNVTATATDTGGLSNSKSFTWTVTNPPTPNPPTLVTVETLVYDLTSRGSLGKLVGHVPLGTACMGDLVSQAKGGNWYEVPLDAVTLSKLPKSIIVVAKCAVA